MKENELKYFYPYVFEKKFNLKEKITNRENFFDELFGKSEFYYLDEKNYGHKRNDKHLSLLEKSINHYISQEFIIWENWYKNGRNIFSFSKELLEMLNHTTINDITYEAFNLPYYNFYISLKPLNLKITNNSDKIIEGVYVNINKDEMKKFNKNDPDIENDFVIEFHFVGDFVDFIKKYHDKVWNDYGSGGQSFWDYAFFFNKKIILLKLKMQ